MVLFCGYRREIIPKCSLISCEFTLKFRSKSRAKTAPMRLAALAQLKTADRRQDKSTRKQPE
jgi:hypothetical protein